jgi:hypothetical protein
MHKDTLAERSHVPAVRAKSPPWAFWSGAGRPLVARSAISADALQSYEGLDEFQHEILDHAVEYVRREPYRTKGVTIGPSW